MVTAGLAGKDTLIGCQKQCQAVIDESSYITSKRGLVISRARRPWSNCNYYFGDRKALLEMDYERIIERTVPPKGGLAGFEGIAP